MASQDERPDPTLIFERARKGIDVLGISRHVRDLVTRTIPAQAKSKLDMLITGKTGVGKEVVADQVRQQARIPDKKYKALNCAALSPNLTESALFGHVKGAFTGATDSKEGVFAEADGGAVFLDELGTMSHEVQAKLLRVIQEKKYYKVGAESTEIPVDCRVFAATNVPRDIREDLRARLGKPVHLPPLRKRLSDVFGIMQGLLKKGESNAEWAIRPPTLVRMLYSPWRANVRELKRAVDESIERWKQEGPETEDVIFRYNGTKKKCLTYEWTHAMFQQLREAVGEIPEWATAFPSQRLVEMELLIGRQTIDDEAGDILPRDVVPKAYLTCIEAIQFVCHAVDGHLMNVWDRGRTAVAFKKHDVPDHRYWEPQYLWNTLDRLDRDRTLLPPKKPIKSGAVAESGSTPEEPNAEPPPLVLTGKTRDELLREYIAQLDRDPDLKTETARADAASISRRSLGRLRKKLNSQE